MTCTRVVPFEQHVRSTAIAPDGQLLAVGLLDGVVQLQDARTGERRTTLGGEISEFPNIVTFSPAGTSPLLLAAGYDDRTVRVWDCSSGACVAELQGHSRPVSSVAFSPDFHLLASGSWDKTVRLWRTDDWRAPPAVLSGHIDFVTGVSFSCDGRLLASCSSDGMMRLWNLILDSGTAAAAATAGPELMAGQRLNCVAFSPVDSRLLACCGGEGLLALARVGAGDGVIAIERKLRGHHSETVWRLAFSPCGRKLASASYDFTVGLWSVASGACLRVLRGHTRVLNAVAFFPNGKQLASGSDDKTLRIWTVCAWSDQTHRFYGAPLKAAVFTLMCVRARLEQEHAEKEQEQGGQHARRLSWLPMKVWRLVFDSHTPILPRLPMEVWLLVFGQLHLALER